MIIFYYTKAKQYKKDQIDLRKHLSKEIHSRVRVVSIVAEKASMKQSSSKVNILHNRKYGPVLASCRVV